MLLRHCTDCFMYLSQAPFMKCLFCNLLQSYTQYIPLPITDLDSWLKTPSIYVFDCSAAGIIVKAFLEVCCMFISLFLLLFLELKVIMIYVSVLFLFLNCLIYIVTFVYFSAQTGVLAPLRLRRRIAFFLLPAKHIKLFPRVQNFLLMCLRLALQHPSRWHCTGLFSLPPSLPPCILCLHGAMPINYVGFVRDHYSVVLWIVLLLTKFLEGKMTVKLFLEN